MHIQPNSLKLAMEEVALEQGWAVVLWNDDVNSMEIVLVILCKVMKWSADEAFQHMKEAHTTGKSLLIITHFERAELYKEQLESCKLTVTLEKQ